MKSLAAQPEFFLLISSPLLLTLTFFLSVMLFQPRSLWSGLSALFFLVGAAITFGLILGYYADKIVAISWLYNGLLLAFGMVIVALLIFPFALAGFFFIEGIRLIRREGFSWTNCLSLGFSFVILFDVLAVPGLDEITKNKLLSLIYTIVTIVVGFLSMQLAVFALSASLNLLHFGKRKRFDQIVVLGSGIFGTKVPPLLQHRIEKGIALQKKNPKAILILSGGQGPGEDIPEGKAMKLWALEHGADPSRTISEEQSRNTLENLQYSYDLFQVPGGKTAIVSNRYHVFRALLLSRDLAIPSKGYGAKATWYFSLNAFLREFAAYLSMTRKRQIRWLFVLTFPFLVMLVSEVVSWLFFHLFASSKKGSL